MTGFCRKTICLFIALLFIFTLSIPAFAVSGRTTVYRTKTGDHYHTGDCRFLGKSKIKTTLDAAVNEYHLTPCSICNPPSFESEAEIAAEPVEPDLNKTTRPANGEVLYSKNKTRPSTLTFENNTNYDCLVTKCCSSTYAKPKMQQSISRPASSSSRSPTAPPGRTPLSSSEKTRTLRVVMVNWM